LQQPPPPPPSGGMNLTPQTSQHVWHFLCLFPVALGKCHNIILNVAKIISFHTFSNTFASIHSAL
jgi:hypothetical protein